MGEPRRKEEGRGKEESVAGSPEWTLSLYEQLGTQIRALKNLLGVEKGKAESFRRSSESALERVSSLKRNLGPALGQAIKTVSDYKGKEALLAIDGVGNIIFHNGAPTRKLFPDEKVSGENLFGFFEEGHIRDYFVRIIEDPPTGPESDKRALLNYVPKESKSSEEPQVYLARVIDWRDFHEQAGRLYTILTLRELNPKGRKDKIIIRTLARKFGQTD